MKKNQRISILNPMLLVAITLCIPSIIFAQEQNRNDSLPQDTILQGVTLQDTTLQDTTLQDTTLQDTTLQDTTLQGTTLQDTTLQVSDSQEKPTKEKQDRKKKDAVKVYGGATFDDLYVSQDMFESEGQIGFMLGGSYKRGRFFYYEFGARYNRHTYQLNSLSNPGSFINGEGSFAMSTIDIPVSGGINFTSFVDRILGVRVYVSVVPAFRIGVGDNNLGITKDNTNTFNLLAQGGIGFDIAFLFLEAGFNYGFEDLLKNDIQSNPRQVFVNLGFRF